MRDRQLTIRPYMRQDRRALLDLNWRSPWTHEHLDWYELEQWLDTERGLALLAWQAEALLGYIGLSQPRAGWAWIRLLAIRDGRMPGAVVEALWQEAEKFCRARGVDSVAILMLTNWLPNYLRRQGFAYADDLISLSHIGSRLPAQPPACITLRAAEIEDVPRLADIDQLAFQAPWAISRYDLRQALRAATNATVATANGEALAYQLTVQRPGISHLARLAVDPAFQRRRIGAALLRRLLADLKEQRVEAITVNTQLSNLPSQRLYERYGFFRNGLDHELWQKRLA